jgi:hypothetical protein
MNGRASMRHKLRAGDTYCKQRDQRTMQHQHERNGCDSQTPYSDTIGAKYPPSLLSVPESRIDRYSKEQIRSREPRQEMAEHGYCQDAANED